MNIYFKIIFLCILLSGGYSFAQQPADSSQKFSDQIRPAKEILRLAWKASNEGNLKEVEALIKEMLTSYEEQARAQAGQLKSFPLRADIESYRTMNDVATSLFVQAEALMQQGQSDAAKTVFQQVIEQYPWAQSWDASRGGYWSVKEKSQASIDMINGVAPKEAVVKLGPHTKPVLAFPGLRVVDYTKYGKFLNAGTKEYHYQIDDRKGLIEAVGEGIYPNIGDIYKDPEYKKAVKEGRLEGNHWDFVNTPDLQAAYYKWATAPEPWGVRLFYMGIILEKAKMYREAIKCYQALIIHYPGTLAWTYWHTPWFPAQAAISKVHYIIRMHPELKLEFKSAKIRILNSFDNSPDNKIAITNPGTLRELATDSEYKQALKLQTQKMKLGKPVKTSGNGTVYFAKYANGHWQLMVKNKPFLIKGTTYAPTKIGQSPDKGTLSNWMDENPNAGYHAWVDKNGNNQQDAGEPNVGDFNLMKEMGVNALRIYHHPMKMNKELLRKMYKDFGFMVLVGDYVGKYAIGSGANWSDGTDYENPEHQKKMMESVKEMVMEYKDEPYVLMWLLGNENNYGVASNADKKPEAYFKFINELALMIKSIDPNHPVALCNGDTLFLDKFAQFAPAVDAYGGNVYRGDYGFGSFWQQVAEAAGKPAFITEYGAPSYSGPGLSKEEALAAQSDYHEGNWLDIFYNSAGYSDGEGNAIGGFAFEWLDEWWKNYEPSLHDTKADVVGPFPGGYYYEEWFGLLGQGNGKNSPYMREMKKVFYTYKKLWNTKN